MTLCARCGQQSDRTIETYWNDRLCPGCCVAVAEYLDRRGDWPPLPPDLIPSTPGDVEA